MSQAKRKPDCIKCDDGQLERQDGATMLQCNSCKAIVDPSHVRDRQGRRFNG